MKAKIYCLFLLSCVLVSCSTSRNTYFNRKYHDLTTHYNVYFNGREILKQANKKTEGIEALNFDEILPVFAFEYEQTPGLVLSDMQRVLDKGTKAIEKHSITAKPKKNKNLTPQQRKFFNKKEFNIYIDDAQLTIGKANMYMHEYGLAEEKFAFIRNEYPDENSIYEAQVLQAVVLSQEKEYIKAEDLLVSLTRKKEIPRKVEPVLEAAFADLYIKQNKYAQAIPHLENALKRAKGKNTKIRYNFILGQLYQKTGNNSKSMDCFKKVVKKNPPYLTAFNAEMAMAFAYDPATQKVNIRKILEKALKNEQNANYHDQIYYAFAKLEESENNIPKALEYYHQSINANGTNTRQKGLSYLALAEYYIKQPDYIKAYTYYDNAASNLGANHSLYDQTSKKAAKYRKLALNMQIVEREDSLQKLANLSDRELENLIDKQVRLAEQETQRLTEEKDRLDKLKSDLDAVSKQGQWYFYNPTSLALGKTDFEMRWGQRKLEDNWRRRNRGVQAQPEYDDWDTPEIETQTADNTQTADKSSLIKNVPKSNTAKQASDDKVANAMFNIGEAFRDDLNDLTKSVSGFETLNERYPANSLQAESYVALFDLYTKLGDSNKAAYYKNLMQQKYPNNPRVLATTDPGYVNRVKVAEAAEELDYNTALNFYTTNKLPEANRAAVNGLNKYPKGRLVPQFTLLTVLTDNYNGDVVTYRNALKGIVEKYPNNAAAEYAKNTLTELEKYELQWAKETVTPGKAVETSTETPNVQYTVTDGKHFFVIIADKSIDINRARFNIASFNASKFLENNYDIQITDYAGNTMLIVGGMKDKKEAMDYYNKITNDTDALKGMSINDYATFVALDKNLELLRKGTTFIDYIDFFNKTYLVHDKNQ